MNEHLLFIDISDVEEEACAAWRVDEILRVRVHQRDKVLLSATHVRLQLDQQRLRKAQRIEKKNINIDKLSNLHKCFCLLCLHCLHMCLHLLVRHLLRIHTFWSL